MSMGLGVYFENGEVECVSEPQLCNDVKRWVKSGCLLPGFGFYAPPPGTIAHMAIDEKGVHIKRMTDEIFSRRLRDYLKAYDFSLTRQQHPNPPVEFQTDLEQTRFRLCCDLRLHEVSGMAVFEAHPSALSRMSSTELEYLFPSVIRRLEFYHGRKYENGESPPGWVASVDGVFYRKACKYRARHAPGHPKYHPGVSGNPPPYDSPTAAMIHVLERYLPVVQKYQAWFHDPLMWRASRYNQPLPLFF